MTEGEYEVGRKEWGLCDASDRARGKTQVVHRRAAQVYMCSGEEWNGMNEEEER